MILWDNDFNFKKKQGNILKNRYYLTIFILLLISSVCSKEPVRIAVFPLKAIEVKNTTAQILTEKLKTELLKDPLNFKLINNYKSDLTEQNRESLSFDILEDEKTIIKIGKKIKADRIITGSISKLGNTYLLTIKYNNINNPNGSKIISGSKKCNADYLLEMIEIAVSALKEKKNIKKTPVPNRLSKYHIIKKDLSKKQKLIYAAKLKQEFGSFKNYTFDLSMIGGYPRLYGFKLKWNYWHNLIISSTISTGRSIEKEIKLSEININKKFQPELYPVQLGIGYRFNDISRYLKTDIEFFGEYSIFNIKDDNIIIEDKSYLFNLENKAVSLAISLDKKWLSGFHSGIEMGYTYVSSNKIINKKKKNFTSAEIDNIKKELENINFSTPFIRLSIGYKL